MEEEGQEQQIQLDNEPIIYSSTGGAVSSVNGYTGDVVLTTSDLENTSDYQTGSEVQSAISTAVGAEVTARQAADNNLQSQIDGITASSDVTDIVGTYAELENYDTSSLGDNDIIKVLQDESQNDETTYYRWSTSTQTFTLIGEEGPYYTKSAVDELLNAKQDTLTEGANVQIQNNVISATDTTYSDFTGTDGTAAGTAGLVPAPATTDAGKFLKADGTWDTAGGSSVNIVQTTGTSTTDVMSQNATTGMVYSDPSTMRRVQIGSGAESADYGTIAIGWDAKAKINAATTAIGVGAVASGQYSTCIGYKDNGSGATGMDSIAIGHAVSASDAGSVAIGSNGTRATGSRCIAIGYGVLHSNPNGPAPSGSSPSTTVAIGSESAANNQWSTAIGPRAWAYYNGSVALGAGSKPTRAGEMNIGSQYSSYGYNSSNYRLLTGVYDGQSDHDAANVGQLNSRVIGSLTAAPTTSTVGTVGALVATVESGTGHLYICTDDTGGSYTWQQLV